MLMLSVVPASLDGAGLGKVALHRFLRRGERRAALSRPSEVSDHHT